MRPLLMLVAALLLFACEKDQDQLARERTHSAIAKADQDAVIRAESFKQHRDEIFAKLKGDALGTTFNFRFMRF